MHINFNIFYKITQENIHEITCEWDVDISAFLQKMQTKISYLNTLLFDTFKMAQIG